MSTYDEENAKADAEMEEFLRNQQSAQQPPEPSVNTTNETVPDVREEDFYADDEDEELEQQAKPTSPAQPASAPVSDTRSTSNYVTMEQLEYERRLAEERGRNAAYNEFIRQPQVEAQPEYQPLYGSDELEFTEEERKKYSEESIRFAEKIAKRTAQGLIEKVIEPLQRTVLEQRDQITSYGVGVANTNAKVLYSAVQAEVPELPQIVQSQEWKNYMASPSPVDSRVRMSDVFLSHLRSGNQHDILKIVKMFKSQNPVPALQQQVAPGQSSVGTPPTTISDRKPKMLSYSKFLDVQRKMQAGKMSYDEYLRYERMYDQAAMEGRIKY